MTDRDRDLFADLAQMAEFRQGLDERLRQAEFELDAWIDECRIERVIEAGKVVAALREAVEVQERIRARMENRESIQEKLDRLLWDARQSGEQ